MKTIQLILLVLAAMVSHGAIRAAEAAEAPADPWALIRDYHYDRRADFAAGTQLLVAKLDDEIHELNAKRATLPESSVKDWDFAMKELRSAHMDLKDKIAKLEEATSETWDQAKERIGTAWQRAQDACDKVRSSTTK